jgi:hypothetical protein
MSKACIVIYYDGNNFQAVLRQEGDEPIPESDINGIVELDGINFHTVHISAHNGDRLYPVVNVQAPADKPALFHFNDQDHGRQSAVDMRRMLIFARDSALGQGAMEWALHMSLMVAMWAMMIEHIWDKAPDGEENTPWPMEEEGDGGKQA